MNKQPPAENKILSTTEVPSTSDSASTPEETLLHYASANRLIKLQDILDQHPLLDIINIHDSRMYTRII
jgi:hypothetical protein